MRLWFGSICLVAVCFVAGCSSSIPEPPELNAETEAAIEAEQAAIDAEVAKAAKAAELTAAFANASRGSARASSVSLNTIASKGPWYGLIAPTSHRSNRTPIGFPRTIRTTRRSCKNTMRPCRRTSLPYSGPHRTHWRPAPAAMRWRFPSPSSRPPATTTTAPASMSAAPTVTSAAT